VEHETVLATWLIAIAAIITAITTIIFLIKQHNNAKKQNEISKKHNEYLGILEIMKIFNDPQKAKERYTLYEAYRNNSLLDKDNKFLGQDLKFFAASVLGIYDQMGKLVDDEYVQKDQFLDMYGGSVIRMYKVLQRFIDKEREERKSKHFMVYFEKIFNAAKDYWKEKFPDEPEPEPF